MTTQLRRDKEIYAADGGELEAAGEQFGGGDAAKVAGPEAFEVAGVNDAEPILVDVLLRFRPVGVWAQGGALALPGRPRPASQEEG